jgi:N utilization substance protein A
VKLSEVIEALVEERGLEEDVLSDIVCEGMLAAYEKRYPNLFLRVSFDKRKDSLSIEVEKDVVATVEDEEFEISVRKAKALKDSVVAGDKLWVPFTLPIGRIEILKAKQIIAQKIRQIEASAVYKAFKDKEGSILQGVVHKMERGGATIKIQDYLAFLPKSLSVPGERLPLGHPVRVLLKEVLEVPRSENQLILDRSSALFVEKLFGLEIPEVFERLVEIKKIVRIPGYKTKIAVVSHDSNIDPVGTCVGVGGVRIKPILKELGTEKVDIIAWTDNLETLIKGALKPAEINRVELSDDNVIAKIFLDDDQRSLAIGRMGQNITLASELSGIHIELVQSGISDLDEKLSEEF